MFTRALSPMEDAVLSEDIANALHRRKITFREIVPLSQRDHSALRYLETNYDEGYFIAIRKCSCPGYCCTCKSLNGSTRNDLQISLETQISESLQEMGFSENYESVASGEESIVYTRSEVKRTVKINICPLLVDYPIAYVWIIMKSA